MGMREETYLSNSSVLFKTSSKVKNPPEIFIPKIVFERRRTAAQKVELTKGNRVLLLFTVFHTAVDSA